MTKSITFVKHRSPKRTAFAASSAALLLGLTACAPAGDTSAGDESTAPSSSVEVPAEFQAAIDWRQFEGETLDLGAQTHPWMNAMEELIPQFEELTGITVNYELLGEDVAVTQIQQQLSAGSPTPDVFMVNAIGQAAASGWLEPLDGYISNPALTDPAWYDIDGIFPASRDFATFDGELLAMPITAEVQVLFVRNDLVPTPPTTMDELLESAKAVTSGDVYGFSSRGIGTGSETPWPLGGFTFSAGGQYLDADGQPLLNNPENVAALETYAELLNEVAPPGAAGWAWAENLAAMEAGTLAMWTDSSGFTPGLNAAYGDSLSVVPLPSIDGSSVPNVWFWTIGINSKSEKKDAAWLFVQWATSTPVTIASQVHVTTARAAAWADATANEAIGLENAASISGILSAADSRPMALAWQNANWPAVADALARAANSVISGADAKTELDAAQEAALQAVN
jgi:multiple sugar transport system substrate-binding protein